jgi:hypothetical protein
MLRAMSLRARIMGHLRWTTNNDHSPRRFQFRGNDRHTLLEGTPGMHSRIPLKPRRRGW